MSLLAVVIPPGAFPQGPIPPFNAKIFNILDVDPLAADGVSAADDAIRNILDDIPNATQLDLSRGVGGGSIYLPSVPSGGEYLFKTPLVIPKEKNITIFGPGAYDAPVTTPDGVDYAFVCEGFGLFHSYVLRDFSLKGCSIAIERQSRGNHEISNIRVYGSAAPAVHLRDLDGGGVPTGSSGIVNGVIRNLRVANCLSAIVCAGHQSDNWLVIGGGSTRCKGVDIELNTASWHVRDWAFEQREAISLGGDPAKPYLKIGNSTATARLKFTGLRFGNEVDLGTFAGPPQDFVVIGPLEGGATGHVPHLKFDRCDFTGRADDGPNADSARSAIRFATGVDYFECRAATIDDFHESVCYFDHGNLDDGQGNIFEVVSESTPVIGTTKLFNRKPVTGSAGSWKVGGFALEETPAEHAARETVQLLRNTTAFANSTDGVNVDINPSWWSESNALLIKDQIGPTGIANTAHRMIKPAAGTSLTSGTVNGVTIGRDVCCSIWLKAGAGLEFARLRISSLIPTNLLLRLTPEWKLWYLSFPATLDTYAYRIYAGVESDPLTGWFSLAYPQAEYGRTPTPYLPRDDTNTAVRPGLSQALGENFVDYGTAAPATGYRTRGDRRINTAPSAAGTAGWICVASGSPGTWKTFGVIAA